MSSSCYFCLLFLMSLFHFSLSTINLHHVLCKDVERHALLQFKHGLIDHADRLASWLGEEKECCNWAGIVCDNFTGHVRQIHLRGGFDYYTNSKEEEEVLNTMLGGDLNPSLLHLKKLEHLDLSCNDFSGIKVPNFIGSLENLRYLNLSGSRFGGVIPPQLGNLSRLEVLDLGDLYTTSMRNMNWLSSLHLLHHLDMSGMNLSQVTDCFQVINALPSLLELHLSSCQLSHIDPHVSILNISSLLLLDLSFNHFNHFVPRWISSMTSLVSLDLSGYGFEDPFRGSFNFENLTALEVLDVSLTTFMNSSFVLKRLSRIGNNLISLDISYCDVSSSALHALHNMTALLRLDASSNQLTKRIPKSFGNLCDLRDINLSDNNFYNASLTYLLGSFFKCKSSRLESLFLLHSKVFGQLPDQLGQLIHLVQLDISDNSIDGMVPDSIGQLSALEELKLSNNRLYGSLPDSLGRLSYLKELELYSNQLSGILPDSLGQLSNLEKFDMSDNHLSGICPNSLGRLSNLVIFDLSYNQLSGTILDSLGQLSNLVSLYLSDNRLTGSLPDSLGQIPNLHHLDFSNNLLTGFVTTAHFSQLASLNNLNGGGNKLTFKPQPVNWIPPFQLLLLNLNSWDLGTQFPLWLQLQRGLIELDISNTHISATMPYQSFWRSFPRLQYLDMSQNHIQEMLWLGVPETLDTLILSSNGFTGKLVDLSNSRVPYVLDLSNNSFTGSLHDFLCPRDDKQTMAINLGNNQLSGVIPECWMKWPYLDFLNLENNNLSGEIPRTLGLLSMLESLNMQGNRLSGSLPVSLMNLTSLRILQLGGNQLDGCIPPWLGTKLSYLRSLNLRSNNFNGIIPHEICYLSVIQILDFAQNNLLGNIPRCFDNFTVLSMKGRMQDHVKWHLYGKNGYVVTNTESLVMKGRGDIYSDNVDLVMLIDLSSNNFSGHIPSELMALQELMSLNLSRNQLIGKIPENIGDMKSLESLDFSLNKLFGELPISLSSLSFLSALNVSYNSLGGKIPYSTQLQSLNESSFFGNNLCGDPLTKRCVAEVPNHRDQEEDVGVHGTDWGLIISMVIGFFVGFWIIVALLIVSRSWRIAYYGFLNGLRYMCIDVMHNCSCKMFHN